MLRKLLDNTHQPRGAVPREGDLYRTVMAFGRTFELRYGYYDERDRQSPLAEPVPIYPDLLAEPIYTDGGEPIVTMLQDACEHFMGEGKRGPDATCADCEHMRRGEEWFGICTCPKKRSINSLI